MTVEGDLGFEHYLRDRKKIVDEALDRYLPDERNLPESIFRAIRYSIFAGGKRIRPILCLAAAEAVGGRIEEALPFACAIELIHTYSLIHDDLPSMDNDDLRRGKPTSHKVFGEGIAILAGDALLTEAFHLMSMRDGTGGVNPEACLEVICEVSRAAGHFGMIGGQVVDILSQGQKVDRETLSYIHTHKTGAMILASVRAGAIIGGADAACRDFLSAYGENIGLAFQIADDILDVEGNCELIGKDTGVDESLQKATYPALLGIDYSKQEAKRLIADALEALSSLDHRADPLRHIARYIIQRQM